MVPRGGLDFAAVAGAVPQGSLSIRSCWQPGALASGRRASLEYPGRQHRHALPRLWRVRAGAAAARGIRSGCRLAAAVAISLESGGTAGGGLPPLPRKRWGVLDRRAAGAFALGGPVCRSFSGAAARRLSRAPWTQAQGAVRSRRPLRSCHTLHAAGYPAGVGATGVKVQLPSRARAICSTAPAVPWCTCNEKTQWL